MMQLGEDFEGKKLPVGFFPITYWAPDMKRWDPSSEEGQRADIAFDAMIFIVNANGPPGTDPEPLLTQVVAARFLSYMKEGIELRTRSDMRICFPWALIRTKCCRIIQYDVKLSLLEFLSCAFEHDLAKRLFELDPRRMSEDGKRLAAATLQGLAQTCASAAADANEKWPRGIEEVPARNKASVEDITSPSPPPPHNAQARAEPGPAMFASPQHFRTPAPPTMAASPGPPAAAVQLFPAAGAAQPPMQHVYPSMSMAPADPNVMYNVTARPAAKAAEDLGWHKSTIYRAERAEQARLAQPMQRAAFVEQYKSAAHGLTTREMDYLNLLLCVNECIRCNDVNTLQWMVNEHISEYITLLEGKQNRMTEQALSRVRMLQEARARDSYVNLAPLTLEHIARTGPPVAYRDMIDVPADRLKPAGFPLPTEPPARPKTEQAKGKVMSGKGEGAPHASNPDMRCAFNTVAAIRRTVQEASGGEIKWTKNDLDPLAIRTGLKIKPNTSVDAVEQVWIAQARPQSQIDVTIAYHCKCRKSGKTETHHEHAMKLDNKATKPSFRATSNCPLCQEPTDEFVAGTPELVAVWFGRMTASNKPSRRQVELVRTIKHNGATYELIAIAHHRGAHEDGHWFAQVRDDGVWTEVNDGVTRKLRLPQKSTTATLLVYWKPTPTKPGQQLTPASNGNRPAPAEPRDSEEAASSCAGKTKTGGACKAGPVRGFSLCAAHLYADLGKGTCSRTTTDGKKCPNTCAKGMQACAMHVLQAAAALGHGPPIPGKGLTSGPSLDENIVIEPTKPAPAVPPPKTASKYTVSEALQRPPQDFRGGHQSVPLVAALKGHVLASLTLLDDAAIPQAAQNGIKPAQRAAHRRVWRRLLAMPPKLRELPLPTAVLTTLEAWRHESNWSPPTWSRTLGAAMGALSRASLYTTSAMDFPMASHAVMKDALKAAKKEENTFVSRPPKPCTKDTMKAAVTNATGAVKEQLILAWLTAGRVGDVLQLKQENVTLKPDTMAVQFRRGKGVELGSPYTVHTACPPEWRPTIEAMLRRRKPGQFLWHADSPKARTLMGKDVAAALKRVDADLEQRSIRRGALQHMATEDETSEEILMMFSGHRRVETLRRYLDWGNKHALRERRGKTAAANLVGGSHSA
jgi:integrase